MKTKLFYLLISISSLSFGQTLENTYTTDGLQTEGIPNFVFNIDGETKYFTYTNEEVNIYDASHKLYKTVSLNLANDIDLEGIFLATDKLFNSNSKIEFLISYYDNSKQEYVLSLYDEDEELLFDFGDSKGIKLFKTPNNEFKLLTSQGNTYKVYGLSGTLSVNQENLLNKQKSFVFPNPTAHFVNITNPLKNNKKEKIQIFDINGRKVLEKTIIGNGENIKLDISGLSKGIYNYKIGEFGNKFVRE